VVMATINVGAGFNTIIYDQENFGPRSGHRRGPLYG